MLLLWLVAQSSQALSLQGDSHAARCLQSPYSLLQLPCEVQIELPLPFWVVPEEDLEVTVNDKGVTVIVDGVMQLRRGYWRHEGQAAKLGSNYKVCGHDVQTPVRLFACLQ